MDRRGFVKSGVAAGFAVPAMITMTPDSSLQSPPPTHRKEAATKTMEGETLAFTGADLSDQAKAGILATLGGVVLMWRARAQGE